MKRRLIYAIIPLAFLNSQSKGQELDWAYSLKDKSVQNFASHIASNGKSFAIVASVNTNVNYDVASGNQAYKGPANVVAKYDSKCKIEWVIEHPGGGNQYLTRLVAMDNAGNVYACGRFSGTKDFDPTSGISNFTAALGSVYIQKLDDNGKLVWVGHISVDGEPVKMGIKSNGNIVVVGRSQDPSTATLSGGATVTVEKGVFILEYGPGGEALNAYGIPTPSSFNNNLGLAIDGNDNVYIGASIDGTMNMDLKKGTLPDTSFSGYDVVIAKYDKNFNYKWHRVFGDKPTSGPDGWDMVNSLAIGKDGYLYAAGWFTWTTDFDPDKNPGLWVKTASTKSQSPDGFLIKYDTSGVIQWIQEAGGHTTITGNADINFMDMVVENNQIIVYGTINGSADFDGTANDLILKTKDNGLGLCIAQYSNTGGLTGAWLLDGNLANENPSGIEKLDDGIVAYGTFQKKLDSDLSAATKYLQTDSTGTYYNADNDLFLVKYRFGFTSNRIASLIHSASLLLYPNPASDFVSIQNALPGTTLQISSIDGTLISRQPLIQDDMINISELPKGIYIVQAIHQDSIQIGRLIVR